MDYTYPNDPNNPHGYLQQSLLRANERSRELTHALTHSPTQPNRGVSAWVRFLRVVVCLLLLKVLSFLISRGPELMGWSGVDPQNAQTLYSLLGLAALLVLVLLAYNALRMVLRILRNIWNGNLIMLLK